jgi:hypothetical protein
MQGAAERLKREHEMAKWAVWHVAILGRVDPDKFPKFDDFVGGKPRRKQTAEEMERALMAWQVVMERAQ